MESVDHDHEHEPEPHGEVHLFVDDVLKDDNGDEITIVPDIAQYLGEDTQTIVSLLVSGRTHIRDIAGDFRRKHSAQRVPGRGQCSGCGELMFYYLNIRSLFCLSLKLQL